MINGAIRAGRANIVGRIDGKTSGINGIILTVSDKTGSIDVELKGGLSLLADGMEKGDLVMAIGDVGKSMAGEIIKKLDNPNYERLRVLETNENGQL